MEILLTRRWKGENSTVSTLKVDGQAHQFCLEDKDRGISSDMDLVRIKAMKIYAKTAIPKGRYRILITHSTRFKRMLPVLINVPGYSGIRIHPGNRHHNTEGCLLPGKTYFREKEDYAVGISRTACDELQNKIAAAIKRGEEVWITISSAY